jgi:hypothetical protein
VRTERLAQRFAVLGRVLAGEHAAGEPLPFLRVRSRGREGAVETLDQAVEIAQARPAIHPDRLALVAELGRVAGRAVEAEPGLGALLGIAALPGIPAQLGDLELVVGLAIDRETHGQAVRPIGTGGDIAIAEQMLLVGEHGGRVRLLERLEPGIGDQAGALRAVIPAIAVCGGPALHPLRLGAVVYAPADQGGSGQTARHAHQHAQSSRTHTLPPETRRDDPGEFLVLRPDHYKSSGPRQAALP